MSQPNLLDRAIAAVSPELALRRQRARYQLAIAGQWLSGSTTRRETKNWRPSAGSADADSLQDLEWSRRRSRDLQRNNPLALGAINTVVTSVGALMLRSRINREILGMSEAEAQAWQRTAEMEFCLWADDPLASDAEATLDFYAQQSLALRSTLESGDVFSTLPIQRRAGSDIGLKVQLIEADRCCNKDDRPNSERLAGGVERGALGEPVAYHFLKRHPYSETIFNRREWDVVPAIGARSGRRQVLHLFDKRRPGQSRGMPYLSPVIEPLRQLGDYTNAEITAAVVSGLFTVFIETENGSGLNIGADGLPATTEPTSGDEIRLGAGSIVDLARGEKVSSTNPGRPNTAFDPFVQAILRQIGVALELPFEVLLKHFTSSYSAARASMLEAWRFFRGRRQWMAAMFCQPIYEAFLEEAVARGKITAPGFLLDPRIRAAYCGAEWVGDSPGQIDPLKEVEAAEKRLNLRLSTYSDEAAAISGQDWERLIEVRAREEQILKAAGLQIAPPAASPAAAPGTAPEADPEDEDDPTDPEELAPGDSNAPD